VSLIEVLEQYDVVEAVPSVPTWDFVWNAVVEEGREKRMLRQPFNKALEEMTFNGEGQSEAISLAESALKVMRSILSLNTSYVFTDSARDSKRTLRPRACFGTVA
jgi:hypothetical protein